MSVYLGKRTWQGAGCHWARRRRALDLGHRVAAVGKELDVIGHVDEEHWISVVVSKLKGGDVVAGDVVLLGSSIVENVFSVLSFFLFPFVDVFRNNEPCIMFLRSLP